MPDTPHPQTAAEWRERIAILETTAEAVRDDLATIDDQRRAAADRAAAGDATAAQQLASIGRRRLELAQLADDTALLIEAARRRLTEAEDAELAAADAAQLEEARRLAFELRQASEMADISMATLAEALTERREILAKLTPLRAALERRGVQTNLGRLAFSYPVEAAAAHAGLPAWLPLSRGKAEHRQPLAVQDAGILAVLLPTPTEARP